MEVSELEKPLDIARNHEILAESWDLTSSELEDALTEIGDIASSV